MSSIRSLARDEHQLIGDIIGDSFSDDPVNLWVFGNERAIKKYNTLCARKLYLKKGFGHVMAEGTGGTLWLPPGIQKYIPLLKSMDIVLAMTTGSGPGSILRGLRVEDYFGRKHPSEPHYYLYAIGARQGFQGRGIGSQLMQAGLGKVDADRMPAYLESSKESNVPFYQRFGFELVEQCSPGKGCPPMWRMWREAVH